MVGLGGRAFGTATGLAGAIGLVTTVGAWLGQVGSSGREAGAALATLAWSRASLDREAPASAAGLAALVALAGATAGGAYALGALGSGEAAVAFGFGAFVTSAGAIDGLGDRAPAWAGALSTGLGAVAAMLLALREQVPPELGWPLAGAALACAAGVALGALRSARTPTEHPVG